VHPAFRQSATNLVHYAAFRSVEMRPLQDRLHELGLSSLSSAENHILSQACQVVKVLEQLTGALPHPMEPGPQGPDYLQGRTLIADHTDALFGTRQDDLRPRIMVTLPTDSAEDGTLIRSLIEHGMDVARINCAHDNVTVWSRMIAYVREHSQALGRPCRVYLDLAGPKIRTAAVPGGKKNPEKGLKLYPGDKIRIVKGLLTPVRRKTGPAILSLTLHEAFGAVKTGERIFFDDGKFAGQISTTGPDFFEVIITQAPAHKNRLKSDKGVNLPDTLLQTPALTPADEAVLPFACAEADIVGYSFVRSAADVAYLYEKIAAQSRMPAVVLKIERAEAVDNLPGLLLAAMQFPVCGVMIARGDLAVEIGFERLSEIQEEILWMCEAAHIPVIWATQVLDQLARAGMATRAEISDAAHATRSECVMLNKGPFILEALSTLDNILQRMGAHVSKKRHVLRPLNIAIRFTSPAS
jgi:pyruvate kinase